VTHAKFSPSSAHRWLVCPGSVQAEAGLPDTSSRAADEGTLAHRVAEHALQGDWVHTEPLVGHDGTVHEVTDQMLDAAEEYSRRIWEQLVAEGSELHVEQRVQLNDHCWGTADALVIERTDPGVPRVVHVVDFKYGGRLVEAHDNPQLMIYGAAALNLVPQSYRQKAVVNMHIFQPRREDTGGETWRVTTKVATELLAWVHDVVEPAIATALEEDPPRVPGDHCTYCKARASCPALREHGMQLAQSVFAEPEAKKPPPVGHLSAAETARLLDAFPLLDLWTKAVREHAMGLAMRGDPPPGYVIDQPPGNRRWRDEDEAAKTLSMLVGEDAFAKKVLSPAQVEKQLGKRFDKKIVGGMVIRPPQAPKLVALGKAKNPIAAPQFDLIEEEREER
jgi:hypothetical protein